MVVSKASGYWLFSRQASRDAGMSPGMQAEVVIPLFASLCLSWFHLSRDEDRVVPWKLECSGGKPKLATAGFAQRG